MAEAGGPGDVWEADLAALRAERDALLTLLKARSGTPETLPDLTPETLRQRVAYWRAEVVRRRRHADRGHREEAS